MLHSRVFVYLLLLPGQMDDACELSRKQRSFGNLEAPGRKVLPLLFRPRMINICKYRTVSLSGQTPASYSQTPEFNADRIPWLLLVFTFLRPSRRIRGQSKWRPLSLPSTTFPVHCALINTSFEAIKLIFRANKASLNKSQIRTRERQNANVTAYQRALNVLLSTPLYCWHSISIIYSRHVQYGLRGPQEAPETFSLARGDRLNCLWTPENHLSKLIKYTKTWRWSYIREHFL